MASHIDISSLENDPRLFLYTSLTAGSSHIITATSRLETILKANKIPFQAIDTATDEKARRLWQRRASGKKLPGLVKEGFVLGDLEDIEEWNEFGELKEKIGPVPKDNAAPPGGQTGVNIAPPLPANPAASTGSSKVGQPSSVSKAPAPLVNESKMRPLPGAAEIAERNSKTTTATTSTIDDPPKPETISSAPVEKEESVNAAKKALGSQHPNIDHLSAPASRLHSGTATPAEPATHDEGAGTAKEVSAPSLPQEVEGMQSKEAENITSQNATAGDEATKSVED